MSEQNPYLGDPQYAGYYTLIAKEDWYFNEEDYPESCRQMLALNKIIPLLTLPHKLWQFNITSFRKDDCVYEKDGLQFCFTPVDYQPSPSQSKCVY